jgi:multiple sugar transport system ATP-binding protein
MQVAEPLRLYNSPANHFVAGFIGSPPMNFIQGTLHRDGDGIVFREHDGRPGSMSVALDERLRAKAAAHVGQAVILGVRPENVHEAANGAPVHARMTLEVAEPMGAETYLHLATGLTTLVARVQPADRFHPGQVIGITFDLAHAHLFDASTEEVL